MKLDLSALPKEQLEALAVIVDEMEDNVMAELRVMYSTESVIRRGPKVLKPLARLASAIGRADRATTQPAKGAKKS